MLRSVLRAAQQAKTLLQQPVYMERTSVCIEQVRTGVVLERLYPPNRAKETNTVRLKPRHYIYRVVENTDNVKRPPIQLILTEDIEGVGMAGELVTVERNKARDKLLPTGQAVYASPENIAEYVKERKDDETPRQTSSGLRTMKRLERLHLRVPMSPKNPWVLNKTHVRVAFRKAGYIMEEDLIEMPEGEITTPQETEVKVTVNGVDTVTVKTKVYYHYHDMSKAAPEYILPKESYEENA